MNASGGPTGHKRRNPPSTDASLVEKILWSTQELKDKFKSMTGKDLNVPQLLNNVRFKDAWISSKSRQPDKSVRVRIQLQKLAEEIVKPKKVRDPRRSEYQIQGAKKRRDKHKNRSFSTERDGDGHMATQNPEDKRPKTSSTPEAQKTAEPQASGSQQVAIVPPPLWRMRSRRSSRAKRTSQAVST